MLNASRRAAHLLNPLYRSSRQSRRVLQCMSLGCAIAAIGSTLPTTLSDDGRGIESSVTRHAHSHLTLNINNSINEKYTRAYQNARKEPNEARRATFSQAEEFLQHHAHSLRITCEGIPAVDENILYIFKRMGIRKEDLRLWTLRSMDENSQFVGIYLATNVDPTDMNNHLIMTTTLQHELDRRRRAGELDDLRNMVIIAYVQYRAETVALEYKHDGRFTPVVVHPLTKKRIKFQPLERMSVRIQEDGMPLLVAESGPDVP